MSVNAPVLNEKKIAIVKSLAHGKQSKGIGTDFNLSPRTVDQYVREMYLQLNVKTRAELVTRARELGLLNGESRNAGDKSEDPNDE